MIECNVLVFDHYKLKLRRQFNSKKCTADRNRKIESKRIIQRNELSKGKRNKKSLSFKMDDRIVEMGERHIEGDITHCLGIGFLVADHRENYLLLVSVGGNHSVDA